MGNRLSHPVHCNEVHGVQLLKVEGTVIIKGIEIPLRPVPEVADIVDGDKISVHACIRQDCHLRLPDTVVRRRDHHPPGSDKGKYHEKTHEGTETVRKNGKCPYRPGGKENGKAGSEGLAVQV